jgi:hypothetical protein
MRFGNQQGDFHRDSPAGVAQCIGTRLRLWTGEWFLDVEEGTPYMGGVLGVRTRATIEPSLRHRIAGTPGFSVFASFDLTLEPETRDFSLHCEVDTIYGPATVQGTL